MSREPSIRALHDDVLKDEIRRVWDENRQVYGAYKVWLQLRREGWRIARCTVERLMRDLGLRGNIKGKTRRTTWPAALTGRTADLVDRKFSSRCASSRGSTPGVTNADGLVVVDGLGPSTT